MSDRGADCILVTVTRDWQSSLVVHQVVPGLTRFAPGEDRSAKLCSVGIGKVRFNVR